MNIRVRTSSTFFKGEAPIFADKEGTTLLHIAGEQPDPAFVPIRVNSELEVTPAAAMRKSSQSSPGAIEIEKQGCLALWTAATGGYMEIVEFLLQHRADPNKTGPPTALEFATGKE